MTPIPATIADDLSHSLWERIVAGDRPSEMELARWRREAKSLERVDPQAFLLVSAQLAALGGDMAKVTDLARTVERLSMPMEIWNNWRILLVNLGLMREAYALAKAGWAQHPAEREIIERLVELAAAFEDAPVLESALEAWQKLHPEKMHPLLAAHALDQLAECHPEDDVALLEAFESIAGSSLQTNTFSSVRIPFLALDAAMRKVDE